MLTGSERIVIYEGDSEEGTDPDSHHWNNQKYQSQWLKSMTSPGTRHLATVAKDEKH